MKNSILILALLLFPFISLSQNKEVFDDEWHSKLESDLEYIVYPNPANNKSHINLRVYRGKYEMHEVKISNSLGKIVYSGVHNKESEIPIHCLEKGLYLLQVSNEKKSLVQTIIIQ
jgi:hypothetical protein